MAEPKYDNPGQPPKFTSVEDLNSKVEAYFNSEHDDKMTASAWFTNGEELEFRPTMSGLAMSLNVSRQTLVNYANKDEYFDTIKKARNIVENALESRLYGNNVTGLIFNLKNNFGWADKTDLNIESPNGTMSPTFVFNPVGRDEPTDTD